MARCQYTGYRQGGAEARSKRVQQLMGAEELRVKAKRTKRGVPFLAIFDEAGAAYRLVFFEGKARKTFSIYKDGKPVKTGIAGTSNKVARCVACYVTGDEWLAMTPLSGRFHGE